MAYQLEVHSDSPESTMEVAERFAPRLAPGDVVALSGDLGAGKTHFVKGLARHFGVNPAQVSSPTYSLIQVYEGTQTRIYHIDAYRLKSLDEALSVGLDEILNDGGISLVEWPENISGLLPLDMWNVKIVHTGPNGRHIHIQAARPTD